MKTLFVVLAATSLLILATCSSEPTTLVAPRPYTAGVRPVLSPGEHWVDFSNSGSSLFGRETSRDLVCIAETADPSVAHFRMRLFRLGQEGPVLVAHTADTPATGPVMFEFDIMDDPAGTRFLLKVEFVRRDGSIQVREKKTTVTGAPI